MGATRPVHWFGDITPRGLSPGGFLISVPVSPESVEASTLTTRLFAAEVTGTTVRSVTWTLTEDSGGAIDASGLHTAPAPCSRTAR